MEVSLICVYIIFSVVCFSIRKSYEIASLYVCAYNCVSRCRLTEEYQSAENIDLMQKHCFQSYLYIDS